VSIKKEETEITVEMIGSLSYAGEERTCASSSRGVASKQRWSTRMRQRACLASVPAQSTVGMRLRRSTLESREGTLLICLRSLAGSKVSGITFERRLVNEPTTHSFSCVST